MNDVEIPRSQGDAEGNDTKRIVWITCLAPVAMIVCISAAYLVIMVWLGPSFWESLDEATGPQASAQASFELPDGSSQISLIQQSLGSEPVTYARDIHLEFTDRPPVTLALPNSPQTPTMMNVYHVVVQDDESYLYLEDQGGQYAIPLQDPQILDKTGIESDVLQTQTYLGRFDAREGSFRFVPADEVLEEDVTP